MMEGHLSQPDSSPQKVAVKTMKRKSSPWTCRARRCLSPWVLVFLLPVSVALSAPWHHLWGCEEGTLTSKDCRDIPEAPSWVPMQELCCEGRWQR